MMLVPIMSLTILMSWTGTILMTADNIGCPHGRNDDVTTRSRAIHLPRSRHTRNSPGAATALGGALWGTREQMALIGSTLPGSADSPHGQMGMAAANYRDIAMMLAATAGRM
jgi:hypothetical protein